MVQSSAEVRLGAPRAGGYAFIAASDVARPTGAVSVLPSEYLDLGYLSEDGVEVTTENGVTKVRDWNLTVVKVLQESNECSLKFTLMQKSVTTARAVFGAENVEVDASGALRAIHYTGEMLPHVRLSFLLEDDIGGHLLDCGDGQITGMTGFTLRKNSVISFEVTVELFKDQLGRFFSWHDAAPAVVTPPVDPTPEPEPLPDPLPATPLSTLWSVSPGLYSSSQSTFDMLEGGQLTSGLSYKRDPITGPYLDKTGTGIQIASKAGLPDLAQHSFRFYFTYPTLPGSGSTQILSPMGIVGGALNPVYRLVVTFAGAWRVHDSANAQKVFGTKNLLPGTRYRMEGQATATSITIRIFEGDSDVVWNEASGSALTLGTVQVWRAGQLTSTPEFPLNISRLQLRNTLEWIGPAAAPVAVDATRDRVLIVGDSLTAMNGANGTGGSLAGRPILDGLQQRRYPLQNVVHYGVGGKKLTVADSLGRTTSQTITDAKAVLGAVDHAVVALGTNDSPSTDAEITAAVNQVIADLKAAGVPRVTWIGAVYEAAGSATAVRLNGLISAALNGASGITARFINPDPLIHNGRSEAGWWIGDGTHMTPTGYTAARAPIYVDAIAPMA